MVSLILKFKYWKQLGFCFIFLSIILLVIASVLNCRIMVDVQGASCLPFTVAAVRYHHVESFKRGDLVVFTPPNHEMGDMFDNKIITKMVGAIPGDVVTVKDFKLSINGKEFGVLPPEVVKNAARYMKRDPDSFNRTEIVPEGKLLMVGTLPRSFDGRYWGFMSQSAILGTAYPIY